MGAFSKEIKIALVAIVGIIVLFFGMQFLKGMSLFSNDNIYYIRFKNISGLSASNPIYANGYQVGVVKSINYDYAHNSGIVVKFSVDNNLNIPKGSSAEIASDLMGNLKMNLLLAHNTQESVHPGDTIVGAISGGLTDQISELLPAIKGMVPKLDSILNSLNTLMADPAIANSLHNVQSITQDLTKSTRQLNTLLGGLNRDVPVLMSKADKTLDNTQQFTANLAQLDVSQTLDEVNQTLRNLQDVTHKLNSNEGSLGLLMNDPSLYNNLNGTMRSADSLLIDLRQHPKRYVHFSLFGRKDK